MVCLECLFPKIHVKGEWIGAYVSDSKPARRKPAFVQRVLAFATNKKGSASAEQVPVSPACGLMFAEVSLSQMVFGSFRLVFVLSYVEL